MHKLFYITLLSLFFVLSNGQTDSLYMKGNVIPVKVMDISEYEVRFRRLDLENGPVYTIGINNITRIKYANGTVENFRNSDFIVSEDITKKKKQTNAFKLHVFDFPTGKISLGYERVLRPGINLDTKFGIFNSNIYDAFNKSYSDHYNIFNPYRSRFGSGTFVKTGAKIILGERINNHAIEFNHFLEGNYFRFNVFFSYLRFEDTKFYYNSGYYPNYQTQITNVEFIQNYNYGFLLEYGKQIVLAEDFTLEGYVGLGYAGSTYDFSSEVSYMSYYNTSTSNVLSAQKLGASIAISCGFNVGFMPKSKSGRKPQSPQN